MPGIPMGPGGAWMASAIGVWPGAPWGPEKPMGRWEEWKCQVEAEEAAFLLPQNHQLSALPLCPHNLH